MRKEDVYYNLMMSFNFYMKEMFCVKNGLIESKNKKIASATKNKKYQLDENIIYTDGEGNAKSSVIVYAGGEEISNSNYVVNYIECTIIFKKTTKDVLIEYNTASVDIVDAFPEDKSDDFAKQMIAISFEDSSLKPFELGTYRQYWKYYFYVDFICYNKVVRDRLSHSFAVGIKNYGVPLFDFSQDNILNQDGTLNEEFKLLEKSYYNMNYFEDLKIEKLNLESLDKKRMYDSCVSGTLTLVF